MVDESVERRQRALEERWRKILLEEPTEENFAKAYDAIHEFMLELGKSVGKSEGAIYRGTVSFAGKVIARLVGRNKDLLEIGCGDGSLAFLLAENDNRVVAVDVSPLALAVCAEEKARRGESRVTFERGEATDTRCPDEAFDFVLSQDLIEHLPHNLVEAHLREAYRVLKPGGSYVFWTPSKLYGSTSMGLHLKEYDLKDAIEAVESAGFKAVWVDARFYKVGIVARMPAFVKPIAYAYEALLRKLRVDLLPMVARQMLAPPILIQGVKQDIKQDMKRRS